PYKSRKRLLSEPTAPVALSFVAYHSRTVVREVPAVCPGATGRRLEGDRHMASEAELKAAGEKSIPKDYDPALYKIRHSMAHVLAQAVVERFPNARPTIGPPVEFG